MKKILAFGASNSSKSINKLLATYSANLMTEVDIEIIDLNDFDMPLFGVDREKEHGIPELAHTFLQKIKASDGLIISFAEHNGAYTAAFKNIFDWVSRIDGNLWSEKPLFALATSPGKRGGRSVLAMATDRFKFMGGNIVAQFSLPSFGQIFDDENGILDEELKGVHASELDKFTAALDL